MLKRNLINIIVVLFVLLNSCRFNEKESKRLKLEDLDISKKTSGFQCSSSLFGKARDFDGKNSFSLDFEFSNIANSDSLINGTCFKLFYLNSKSGELYGYWGERNDSILFVPYKTKSTIQTEFLIYVKNSSNFHYTKPKEDFNNEKSSPMIGQGYSCKTIVSGNDFVSLIFYVNPNYIVNITKDEYFFESVPLLLYIDFNLGVTFFSYDVNLEKQAIIPWVEQMFSQDFTP